MRPRTTPITILILLLAALVSGCSLAERFAPLAVTPTSDGRVELAHAGIAITFPEDWLVESPPTTGSELLTLALGSDQRDLLVPLIVAVPPTMHDRCALVDISALVRVQPGWSTLDDVVAGFERMVNADTRWVDVEGSFIDLPAGRTGQLARNRAGEAESVTTFVFSREGSWFVLECVAHTIPAQDWGSIARAFEFLPAAALAEPVGFTGSLGNIGDECGLGVSVEVVDGVQQTRDYCYTKWLDTTDPRFSGTYTQFVNVDEYVGGDIVRDGVSMWVSTATHRVENDYGAWLGRATASVTVDDIREGGQITTSPQVVAFTGSGGYEDSTAVAWWQPQDAATEVRGVIYKGRLPAAPPPAEMFPFLPAED